MMNRQWLFSAISISTGRRDVVMTFIFSHLIFVLFLNNAIGQPDILEDSVPLPEKIEYLPADSAELENSLSEAFLNGEQNDSVWISLLPSPGEMAPDFTLEGLDGELFNLYEVLHQNVPVLIVSASMTCSRSQRKFPKFKELSKRYGEELTIVVVYTIEAHPYHADSPYPGLNEHFERTDWSRTADQTLTMDPVLYGDRRALCKAFTDQHDLDAMTVLIDNPANEFWKHYGQAPNMAFLIAPDRKIIASQLWFNRTAMVKYINNLLER